MQDIDRPIFVVGVDHSGTSILYRMLARHPEAAWFTQYSLRAGELPGRMRLPFSGAVNRAARRLHEFTWRKQREEGYLPEPREGSGIWRHLVPRSDGFMYASDYSEEMAARVRAALHSELRAWRRRRMLVKIPYLTRRIQLLDRILPDALFVHIVRDGRAVSLSNRSRFETGDVTRPEALRRAARQWVETLEYVMDSGRILNGRLLNVRYEAFCGDVHEALSDVFRFTGLDPERVSLESLPRTLVPTNDRWVATCPEPERRLLDGVLSPTLRTWGYPPFAPGAGPSVYETSGAVT
jgi:hypothetical protein